MEGHAAAATALASHGLGTAKALPVVTDPGRAKRLAMAAAKGGSAAAAHALGKLLRIDAECAVAAAADASTAARGASGAADNAAAAARAAAAGAEAAAMAKAGATVAAEVEKEAGDAEPGSSKSVPSPTVAAEMAGVRDADGAVQVESEASAASAAAARAAEAAAAVAAVKAHEAEGEAAAARAASAATGAEAASWLLLASTRGHGGASRDLAMLLVSRRHEPAVVAAGLGLGRSVAKGQAKPGPLRGEPAAPSPGPEPSPAGAWLLEAEDARETVQALSSPSAEKTATKAAEKAVARATTSVAAAEAAAAVVRGACTPGAAEGAALRLFLAAVRRSRDPVAAQRAASALLVLADEKEREEDMAKEKEEEEEEEEEGDGGGGEVSALAAARQAAEAVELALPVAASSASAAAAAAAAAETIDILNAVAGASAGEVRRAAAVLLRVAADQSHAEAQWSLAVLLLDERQPLAAAGADANADAAGADDAAATTEEARAAEADVASAAEDDSNAGSASADDAAAASDDDDGTNVLPEDGPTGRLLAALLRLTPRQARNSQGLMQLWPEQKQKDEAANKQRPLPRLPSNPAGRLALGLRSLTTAAGGGHRGAQCLVGRALCQLGAPASDSSQSQHQQQHQQQVPALPLRARSLHAVAKGGGGETAAAAAVPPLPGLERFVLGSPAPTLPSSSPPSGFLLSPASLFRCAVVLVVPSEPRIGLELLLRAAATRPGDDTGGDKEGKEEDKDEEKTAGAGAGADASAAAAPGFRRSACLAVEPNAGGSVGPAATPSMFREGGGVTVSQAEAQFHAGCAYAAEATRRIRADHHRSLHGKGAAAAGSGAAMGGKAGGRSTNSSGGGGSQQAASPNGDQRGPVAAATAAALDWWDRAAVAGHAGAAFRLGAAALGMPLDPRPPRARPLHPHHEHHRHHQQHLPEASPGAGGLSGAALGATDTSAAAAPGGEGGAGKTPSKQAHSSRPGSSWLSYRMLLRVPDPFAAETHARATDDLKKAQLAQDQSRGVSSRGSSAGGGGGGGSGDRKTPLPPYHPQHVLPGTPAHAPGVEPRRAGQHGLRTTGLVTKASTARVGEEGFHLDHSADAAAAAALTPPPPPPPPAPPNAVQASKWLEAAALRGHAGAAAALARLLLGRYGLCGSRVCTRCYTRKGMTGGSYGLVVAVARWCWRWRRWLATLV